MSKQSRVIFQKDWMKFHPYRKSSSSDFYYLDLCNKVYNILEVAETHFSYFEFYDDEKRQLAIYLTCYFEDIISGTKIWQTFTNLHFELYGKYLPFYNPDEYYPDEINQEDIAFLSWHFFNMMQDDSEFFNPYEIDFQLIARSVYELFDAIYETAPENDLLKEYLAIPDEENDYYQTRYIIDWLFMNSYLFHFHENEMNQKIDQEYKEMIEKNGKVDSEYFMAIINDTRDRMVNNRRSHLLALRGNEWMANLLGKDHRLYKHLLERSDRKTGFFLYKGETREYVIIEHIASGKSIHLTKKSFNSRSEFKINKSIFLLSIVLWQNEWWFTGVFSLIENQPKLLQDEKNSTESKSLFQDDIEKMKVEIERQYQVFLEFNNQSPIAFFNDKEGLNDFLNGYFDLFNKKRAEEKKLKRNPENDAEINKAKENRKVHKGLYEAKSVVFFDRRSGIEMLYGYNDLIPDERNPFFEEIDTDGLYDLFKEPGCSAQFVKYLVETYPEIRQSLMNSEEYEYLITDLDFILRYFKNENYFINPRITMV